MPYVYILYVQLKKSQAPSKYIQRCLQNFVKSIKMQGKFPDPFHNTSCVAREECLAKRTQCASSDEEISLILKEPCNIISHYCSRLEFPGRLVAATLFQSGSFSNF